MHTADGSGPNSSGVINSIRGNWGFFQLKVSVTQQCTSATALTNKEKAKVPFLAN